MNRPNMKSNISFQPEGRFRGSIPRRKATTKSHFLNGVNDFDMELSLAIQESLKYVQQKEQPRCNDDAVDSNCNEEQCFDSVTEGGSDEFQPESKSNRSRSRSTMNSDSKTEDELRRLKDLLLSQLELIQCQQEELAKKDREIKSLLSANNTLQCRLERMERRMSIMKQREVSLDGQQAPESSQSLLSPTHIKSQKSFHDASRIAFKKRQRSRNNHFTQRKRYKTSLVGVPSTSNAQLCSVSEASDTDHMETNTSDAGESETEEPESRIKASEDDRRSESPDSLLENPINYPIMQTDVMYHLYYPKHACPSSPDAKRIQEQLEVETPSWRLKPLTNLYQLEGTENITDEAYDKRHQKFEHEEKRRKRWDMQRLRELRQFEKLEKQKEEELRCSQEEADMETFLPSVSDLKHIEITESLPVMAFGQPIPYICPAEFEISWDMNSSASSTSTAKQKSSTSPSRRH